MNQNERLEMNEMLKNEWLIHLEWATLHKVNIAWIAINCCVLIGSGGLWTCGKESIVRSDPKGRQTAGHVGFNCWPSAVKHVLLIDPLTNNNYNNSNSNNKQWPNWSFQSRFSTDKATFD